ncbi:MAG: Crp/Fnr family transcriptional regulator [Oscillochloridaceae bacterium]|nr:Crp/Fnr family transcriptional regulator [Chloroflexaceae bacterium]MDW8389042.1 Crp/Fnr family transcriptional regulator [Oscillochloridaceae bacterium]
MTSYAPMLEQMPPFAGLPETTLRALAAIMTVLERPAGTTLQLEGEPAEAMYLVVAGRVKLYRLSTGGREQVLGIVGAGGLFNAVPIFDGGPCPASAETLDDAVLAALPRQRLLELIDSHPALARALLSELAARLRHMVDLVDTLALHTVQGRLARLLLEQARAAERGAPVAPLTQAQMAARLGTVREMVSRTLKSFEALGLIRMERNAIHVLDRAGLERQTDL